MRRSRWQARASRPRRWGLVLSAAVAGCGASSTLDDLVAEGGANCPAGSEGCSCYPSNACDVGLTCASGLCVSPVPSSVGGSSGASTRVSGGRLGIGANPTIGTGGMFIPGTGAAPAMGGTPNIGTGATGAQICCSPFQAQGYVVSGPWHGYAWTAAVTSAATLAGTTTTITPPDFSAVPAGAPQLCVAGSVAPASDYGGVALLGVNVNQPQVGMDGGEPLVQTAPIGGIGITVRYTNPGVSVLRVQIQTPLGETSPTGRWCATLSGAGGTETVTWDMFWGGVADGTQGCWNSGGSHPSVGTQIGNVALLVPGSNSVAVPYSFCLQGIAQAG